MHLCQADYRLLQNVLYGLPQAQIDKTQRAQNAAAIFKQPKFSHTTTVLNQLHWLNQLSSTLNSKPALDLSSYSWHGT